MGTVKNVDRDPEPFLYPGVGSLHLFGGDNLLSDVRLPSPSPTLAILPARIDEGLSAAASTRTSSHQRIKARFVNVASRLRSKAMFSIRENPCPGARAAPAHAGNGTAPPGRTRSRRA